MSELKHYKVRKVYTLVWEGHVEATSKEQAESMAEQLWEAGELEPINPPPVLLADEED